jgi:hypothetical protein
MDISDVLRLPSALRRTAVPRLSRIAEVERIAGVAGVECLRRPGLRAAGGAVALALAAAALTGCNSVTRALDCAKSAATIAGDVQDLQSTATNIGQVSDASRRRATLDAFDKVQSDISSLGDRTDDSGVSDALGRLGTAVHGARTTAADGGTPDLRPVTDAAGNLTDVCTPG